MSHTPKAERQCNVGRRRQARAIKLSLVAATVLYALPSTSFAELHFRPFVSGEGEYESNVFYLPDDVYAVSGNERARSDVVRRYMVGLDTDYQWSQQRLFLTADGRRYRYDRFTQLDHDEHTIYGGGDGKIGSAVSGGIHYRDEQRMASFAERLTTQLALEKERVGDALLNVAVTPTWDVELVARARKFDSPLVPFPEYGFDENSGSITPMYLSGGPLKVGFQAEYLQGKFHGLPTVDKYHQQSFLLTADYELTDVTKIHGDLGYTVRQDDSNPNSNVSTITGTLAYDRSLTGKTSINAQLFRRVETYVAGANAVIQTGGSVAVSWRPTEKTAIDVSYQQTHDDFEDTVAPSAAAASRVDRLQTGSLALKYQPLHWLSFRPYTLYQRRNSNIAAKSYQTFFAGLEIRVQLGAPH